jgi:hypothetical protein
MTPDQIEQFATLYNDIMSGRLKERMKLKFLPKGKYTATKEHKFDVQYDEWIARIVAIAFGVNPQQFIMMMNRSTGQLQDEQQTESDGEGSELTADHRWVITLLVIAAVIAAIGFVLWRIRQRILRRQLANRAGIDSEDPATAITAMFPYAVRWLQPAGIDASGKAFDSLIPVIKADLSEQYADDYTDMYDLWKEAAYSDHAMTEESRQEMKEFLNDTITMIKEKGNIRTNFVNAIRYAL